MTGSGSFTSTHQFNISYFREIYSIVRDEVESSPCTDIVWVESKNEIKLCFIVMVQMYRKIAACTLKANMIVPYPVHSALLNFTQEFCPFFIDHGHKIARLLPDSRASRWCQESYFGNTADGEVVSMSDELQRTNRRYGRDFKLRVLRKTMEMILLPVMTGRRYGFDVSVRNKQRVLHPIIASYCCNIPEVKDMSKIHNG